MTRPLSRFIDIHHHIVPSWYRDELIRCLPNASGQLPFWSVESDFALMERQGISTAIFSLSDPGVSFGDPIASPYLARRYNEYAAALVQQYPCQYGAFATLPLPNVLASIEEAIYALDILKLDGIGLLSNHSGFYLGDERTDELLSELNRRKAVVFLHPTEPAAVPSSLKVIPTQFEYFFETTRAIILLFATGKLEQYPEIRWLLAYAGGTLPTLFYQISAMIGSMRTLQSVPSSSTHVQKDVLNMIQRLYYDTALFGSQISLSTLQTLIHPSHILFGSDATFTSEVGIVEKTQELLTHPGFHPYQQQMIVSENAQALFPRLNRNNM